MASQNIGPRRPAGSGIQASHSWEAHTREIGGQTYRFVRHHSIMSPGHAGIQAYRMMPDGNGRAEEILSAGDRIPRPRWAGGPR